MLALLGLCCILLPHELVCCCQVHAEVERRRESSKQSFLRTQHIKHKYQRHYPEVYTLSVSNHMHVYTCGELLLIIVWEQFQGTLCTTVQNCVCMCYRLYHSGKETRSYYTVSWDCPTGFLSPSRVRGHCEVLWVLCCHSGWSPGADQGRRYFANNDCLLRAMSAVQHMHIFLSQYSHPMCCAFPCAAPNVFSFPVLTVEYCSKLLEELDHFEKSDMPKGRPNTMNNYGVSIIHTCRGLIAPC